MPRIVLASTSVAYNLYDKCKTEVANFPQTPRELIIRMPASTIEAANTAASFTKLGQPDSDDSPTAISQPGAVLVAGDMPHVFKGDAGVPVKEMWLNASVVNAVLYVYAH